MKKMDRSKYSFCAFIVFSLFFFSSQPVFAGITNGDFSQDPNGSGWTLSNSYVYSDSEAGGNGIAVLLSDYEESTLTQYGIFLLPNETQLMFDVVMYSSIGGETDTFTATFSNGLYSDSRSISSSSISSSVHSETIIIDLTGWNSGLDPFSPYTLSFQLANQLDDDIITYVLIDNVKFVPAPGAFLLAAIGLFSTAASRKKLKA